MQSGRKRRTPSYPSGPCGSNYNSNDQSESVKESERGKGDLHSKKKKQKKNQNTYEVYKGLPSCSLYIPSFVCTSERDNPKSARITEHGAYVNVWWRMLGVPCRVHLLCESHPSVYTRQVPSPHQGGV